MTAAELASGLQLPPQQDEVRLWSSRLSHWFMLAGIFALTLLVLAAAAVVIYKPPYKSGDDIGYNLGLVGGLMMLTLLLYPARKRMRSMERMGGMVPWFRWHMVFGILGPVLVVFHSTFRTGSMNAWVALYSMLLVAGSGIFGRFFYRQIHRGLYGSRMTLAEATEDLRSAADNVQHVLGQAPGIGEKLTAFQLYATSPTLALLPRAWRFVSLRVRARAVARSAYRRAKAALTRQAADEGGWSRAELVHHRKDVRNLIDTHAAAVCSAAQFSAWERLFSLWHVAHVPLVYLMVVCAVVHVVAVHMY